MNIEHIPTGGKCVQSAPVDPLLNRELEVIMQPGVAAAVFVFDRIGRTVGQEFHQVGFASQSVSLAIQWQGALDAHAPVHFNARLVSDLDIGPFGGAAVRVVFRGLVEEACEIVFERVRFIGPENGGGIAHLDALTGALAQQIIKGSCVGKRRLFSRGSIFPFGFSVGFERGIGKRNYICPE